MALISPSIRKNPTVHGIPPSTARVRSLKGNPDALPRPRRTTAGLEPYTPTPNEPWDNVRVKHLLRRTLFGATKQQIDTALTMQPADVVDMLLTTNSTTTTEPSFVHSNYNFGNEPLNRLQRGEVTRWILRQMIEQDFSIRERMVRFWRDHFIIREDKVVQPQFHFWFDDLFRRNPFGNYRDLLNGVSKSAAMLVQHYGYHSTKNRIYDDHAYAVIHYHTMGESASFSEQDVREAARAMTGWTIRQISPGVYHPYETAFYQSRFDATTKTFLGKSAVWKMEDIVNLIFSERPQDTARFICRKLYRSFVYEEADETIVQQMADLLIANNWFILPVLSALLKSAHFFDRANMGGLVTTPLEYFVGMLRSLRITASDTVCEEVFNALAGIAQPLLLPPEEGWAGYRSWLNSGSLIKRLQFLISVIDDELKSPPNRKFNFNAVDFIKTISQPNDAKVVNQAAIDFFLPQPINQTRTAVSFGRLLSGWKDYEWDINNPGAPDRTRILIKHLLSQHDANLV